MKDLKDTQNSNVYTNSNFSGFEQVFPKPEKLKTTAKFNFNFPDENNNDNHVDSNTQNQWEDAPIEIDEEFDNFPQEQNIPEKDTWNQV